MKGRDMKEETRKKRAAGKQKGGRGEKRQENEKRNRPEVSESSYRSSFFSVQESMHSNPPQKLREEN